MFNFSKKTKGFTLIELLVVIAIIGILASIVLVGVNRTRMRARDTKRLSEMRQIVIALEMFNTNFNRYPGPTDGVSDSGECVGEAVSCGASDALEPLIDPYISEIPTDPKHNCTGATCGGANTYYYFYDPSNPECEPVLGFHLFEYGPMQATHGRKDTTTSDDVMDIANSEYVICLSR